MEKQNQVFALILVGGASIFGPRNCEALLMGISTYFAEDEASIAHEIATFTVADSFDAYAVFQHLLRREIRRSVPSADFLARFERHSLIHLRRMKRAEVFQEMQALSLITIVNVAEHGKSRADHIFLD